MIGIKSCLIGISRFIGYVDHPFSWDMASPCLIENRSIARMCPTIIAGTDLLEVSTMK